MNKIKTVKIKEEDGSISEESYTIAADAINIDMQNGKDLQETVGNIDVDNDGDIAIQLKNKINKNDIIDNLNSTDSNKVLSANQGKIIGDNITILNTSNSKKPYYYNSVADMKADTKLKAGDMAITLGYYEVNDGGAGEYKIIDDNYAVDDGGSYHGLNNGLFAELIIRNNEINIKQCGAIEDGEADDYPAFTAAISCLTNNNAKILKLNNKQYYLSTSLTFQGISLDGNNAEINFNATNSSNSYPFLFKGEDFFIQNMKITLEISYHLPMCMRIQNAKNIKISNIQATHTIDLFHANHNINCENLILNSGLCVRELYQGITENITFTNCVCTREVKPDEVIWVVSSRGTIKNINFVDCSFIHNGGTENCVAVSAYYDGSVCENVKFTNCTFDLKSQYSTFHIGGSSSEISGITKNVIFENCIFKHDNYTNTEYFFLNQSKNKIYFKNCDFDVKESGYGFTRDCVFNDCEINILSNKGFRNCEFNNCNITNTKESAILLIGREIVHNSKIIAKNVIGWMQLSVYPNGDYQEYINCDLENDNSNMFYTQGSTCSFRIINCKINNNNQSFIFSNYLLTEQTPVRALIQNCNFVDGIGKMAGSSEYFKVNFIDNFNNGEYITGIPTQNNARLCMALNTIIRANGTTGLFYKKNVDDNQTSSWTLYPIN